MEVLHAKGDFGNFRRVIIDECTQASEPAALVALGRKCEQVVLVGDHKQLPATVLSLLAQRNGLGQSLFERMVSTNGISPTLLTEQRRMHSSIAEFPNRTFYNSELVNAVDDSLFAPVPGFAWPQHDCRVCFVDVSEGTEGQKVFSKFNTFEAEAVADVVGNVIDAGFPPQDIGILAAYVAQRNEIIRALSLKGLSHVVPMISIDTVDGYQGNERELILFSATRSNNQQSIGFLSDARRMNVMLTRAKKGLIVFCNAKTLRDCSSHESHWRSWLEWVEGRGSVLSSAEKANFPAPQTNTDVEQLATQGAPTGYAELGMQQGAVGMSGPTGGRYNGGRNGQTLGDGCEQPVQFDASPQPPSPPASFNWERVFSEDHQRYYYWDKATNTTQWDAPPQFTSS